MCILYIMITVYNNISVKYLKSKNKQDAMYVHINRLSFILFLCLPVCIAAPPLLFFVVVVVVVFSSGTGAQQQRQPLKKRLMTELQIGFKFCSLFFLWHLNVHTRHTSNKAAKKQQQKYQCIMYHVHVSNQQSNP